MKNLSDNDFKSEVLESETPVVVDFWSIGCGPCRQMEPLLKAAEAKHDKVKFAKIQPEDGMGIFTEYGVSAVPTLILFKNGTSVKRKTGMMQEAELEEWLGD